MWRIHSVFKKVIQETEREIKETILFTIATKRIKYLGINLPKELWCWRRLLRVPWTARRSNQSILKEISPGYSFEGLMLKLKLQYFGHWCEERTNLKRPWCWERLRVGGEGDNRGRDGWMASQTHRHGFGWTPGVGDGQGGLACCGSWGHSKTWLSN